MINVYSQSEDELGRLLSNFAHTPFDFEDNHFESVEAWWYWYSTGKQHHQLKTLYGFNAKHEGKKYQKVSLITPDILIQIYRVKLEQNPYIKQLLIQYDGEFDHYYVYNDKKVPATKWLWTAKLWETVRDEMLNLS